METAEYRVLDTINLVNFLITPVSLINLICMINSTLTSLSVDYLSKKSIK